MAWSGDFSDLDIPNTEFDVNFNSPSVKVRDKQIR